MLSPLALKSCGRSHIFASDLAAVRVIRMSTRRELIVLVCACLVRFLLPQATVQTLATLYHYSFEHNEVIPNFDYEAGISHSTFLSLPVKNRPNNWTLLFQFLTRSCGSVYLGYDVLGV